MSASIPYREVDYPARIFQLEEENKVLKEELLALKKEIESNKLKIVTERIACFNSISLNKGDNKNSHPYSVEIFYEDRKNSEFWTFKQSALDKIKVGMKAVWRLVILENESEGDDSKSSKLCQNTK